MATRIRTLGIVATWERGEWTSTEKALGDILNMNDARRRDELGYDPSPAHAAALFAIETFGGEILEIEATPPGWQVRVY